MPRYALAACIKKHGPSRVICGSLIRTNRASYRERSFPNHREIARAGSNPGVSTSRDQVRCCLETLEVKDLPRRPERLVQCAATREAGHVAMRGLLETDKLPTAVACHNDTLAFGAMPVLNVAGLKPGSKISIAGCDDVVEAALWKPGLTTVDVPRSDPGRQAAQAQTRRLANPSDPLVFKRIDSELTMRGPTGGPPTSAQADSVAGECRAKACITEKERIRLEDHGAGGGPGQDQEHGGLRGRVRRLTAGSVQVFSHHRQRQAPPSGSRRDARSWQPGCPDSLSG